MWQWDRRIQGLVLLLAAALIFAGGVKYAGWQAGRLRPAAVVNPGDAGGQGTGKKLAVHVTGAVSKPGVYYFTSGSRVMAAVERAGPLPEADLDSLNLAQQLADGQKILVPRRGANGGAAGGTVTGTAERNPFGAPATSSQGGGKVNINTASAEELDQVLPGIGPTLAGRIVDYRNRHGPFRSPEDLKNVSGIGNKRFEQLKDLITI